MSDDGGIQWFQQAQEQRREEEEWLADRKAQLEYLDFLDWLHKEAIATWLKSER